MSHDTLTGTPRVSVLLPCYNAEDFLRASIASILDQTYRDLELVIIDDGSTDGSLAIMQYFQSLDERVRVLTKPNGGIVSALNAGLALCKGEYIARMDADDVSFSDRIEYQVDYLDNNPGCVLVGGFATGSPVRGEAIPKTSGGPHKTTSLDRFPPRVAVSVHPLVMMRKSALVDLGGYRSDFQHAEDTDLFLRLSRYGSIDNPDKVMLYWRRHRGAISIVNAERQERAAAMAEIDAIKEAGFEPPPAWVIEPYVRLRIWRRYQTDDPDMARAMHGRLLLDLLSLEPRTLFSKSYFAIRLRLLAAAHRSISRRLTDALARRTAAPSVDGQTRP